MRPHLLPLLRFAPVLAVVLVLAIAPIAAPTPAPHIPSHATPAATASALPAPSYCRALQNQLNQQSRALTSLQEKQRIDRMQRELEHLQHARQIERLQHEKRQMAYIAAIIILVLLLGLTTGSGLLLRKRQQQLRHISEIDALTGLNNRRAATAALDALAMTPCAAECRHVVFLIDVDHFKQINDHYGHACGDEVLTTLAQRLKSACRPTDLVARWGGEEFLVACPNLTPDQAQHIAERLRRAMAYTLETDHSRQRVTVSVGLAPIPFYDNSTGVTPAHRWDYALRMADRALYAAKRHRNAWVGYWGAQLRDEATAEAVLEQPEAAPELVTVLSSVPRIVQAATDIARARRLRALRAQL